ncbi:MAG: hypothetical protein KDC48_21780 [Planctomycetes bacterium]|nr:hypothetical protein [Planctomycetota bacterium]
MKALLIDPAERRIEPVDVADRSDIARLVGYDTIATDEVGPDGDTLHFDEECFLRGAAGRFRIDSVVPVSGRAVVVGSADGGAALRDVAGDVDSLKARLTYL